jgi:hypothetical protein
MIGRPAYFAPAEISARREGWFAQFGHSDRIRFTEE